MGQLLVPSLPSSPSPHPPIPPFVECEVASSWRCAKCIGCSFPRVTTSLLVTSDCLQREHGWKGKDFIFRVTALECTNEPDQAGGWRGGGGGHLIPTPWGRAPARVTPQPSCLSHFQHFSSRGQRLTWLLVWRRNWASPTGPLPVFLFMLHACREHPLSPPQCFRFYWGSSMGRVCRCSALLVTR